MSNRDCDRCGCPGGKDFTHVCGVRYPASHDDELIHLRAQLGEREAEIERLRQLLDSEQKGFASYELKLKAELAAAVKVIEAARGLDCKHGDCDDCISICWEETVLHEALHEWDAEQKGRTE